MNEGRLLSPEMSHPRLPIAKSQSADSKPGPSFPNPRFARRGVAMGAGLLVLLLLSSGCGPKPYGPAFEMSPLPPPNRARLYIYRLDERTSLASVRASIDGQEMGPFRDREYETIVLPAGMRTVRAGLRGFGFMAWGWSEHKVRLRAGETAYLMLSVRMAEQTAPTSREVEIAGRDSGTASENVFIVPRSQSQALSEMQRMTRLVSEAGSTD